MQQYFAFYPETFMQIRDLTKRQCYNLRRRCAKEKRQHLQGRDAYMNNQAVWDKAYSAGVRAGLQLHPSGRESISPPPA